MEAFELRLWDGRIGRWLTVDPYAQYDSPYLGMGNNPINLIDPDGGSTEPPTEAGTYDGQQYFDPDTGVGYVWGEGNWHSDLSGGMNLTEVVVTGPKKSGWSALEFVHIGLDVAGMVPLFGEIADGANALIYLAEGDHFNAGLSAAAMIPIVGYGANAIKYGKKVDDLIDIYSATRNGKKYFGQSVNYLTRYTKKVAKEMRPKLLGKVPKRLANAVEQQLINIHGLRGVGKGNGLADNVRNQMSLKNQVKNKDLMKEAMDWLDNNVDNWMGL